MENDIDKDCFDCEEKGCKNRGYDVLPHSFCLLDPIIDRYEKEKKIKKPCSTCKWRGSMRCSRCTHGQEMKG